jgi:hypothetical protein
VHAQGTANEITHSCRQIIPCPSAHNSTLATSSLSQGLHDKLAVSGPVQPPLKH